MVVRDDDDLDSVAATEPVQYFVVIGTVLNSISYQIIVRPVLHLLSWGNKIGTINPSTPANWQLNGLKRR